MKKFILLSGIFFISSGVVYSLEEQPVTLTGYESRQIAGCKTNISDRVLSPLMAGYCIDFLHADNDRITGILAAGAPKDLYSILTYSNALKDLGDLLSIPELTFNDVLNGYKVRLTTSGDCALCDVGLGPEPKKMFGWIQTHYKDKLPVFKKGVMMWNFICPSARAYLVSKSFNKTSWNSKNVPDRETIMKQWAGEEAGRLFSLPIPEITEKDLNSIHDIFYYVDSATQTKLNELYEKYNQHLKELTEAVKKAIPDASEKTQKKKLQDVLSALQNAGTPTAKSQELGKTFDLSEILKDKGPVSLSSGSLVSVAAPGSPQNLDTKEFLQKLEKFLFNEIRDTRTGDSLIKFYNDPVYRKAGDNMLKTGIRDIGLPNGHWSPDKKEIVFNKILVEKWMADKKYTYEQLLKNDSVQEELARYLAPLFVHEAVHQRQTAWAQANDIPDYYQLEKEVESFSTQGLFVLEKSKKESAAGNAGYVKEVAEYYVARARIMKESGSVGMRKYVVYYEVPSFEGQSAMNLRHAAVTASLPEKWDEQQLRWYKLVMAKRDADDIWLMKVLAETMETKKKDDSGKTKAPPSPVK